MNEKNRVLKRFIECLLVFISVGTLYFIGECVFKQRMSHWTMFILSGTVGLIGMLLNDKFTYEMDFGLQVFICTITTTVFEYFVGRIFNADFSIWDYRNLHYQINGQVSLLFSLLWALLFTIGIPILDYIEWKVFKYKPDTPPYYKIFGRKFFQF